MCAEYTSAQVNIHQAELEHSGKNRSVNENFFFTKDDCLADIWIGAERLQPTRATLTNKLGNRFAGVDPRSYVVRAKNHSSFIS